MRSASPRGGGDGGGGGLISDDAHRFSQTFDEVEEMGEGAFGQVLSARNVTDGRRYAVKRIPFYFQAHESFKIETLKKLVLREAKVLAALDHQNVVRLLPELGREGGHCEAASRRSRGRVCARG